MSGVVTAIYASFFLALTQGSLKKSFKELEPSVAFFFGALFGLLLWIPVALFFGVTIGHIWLAFPYAIISAILSEAFYFFALSKGQLSITSILISSYPIYTIIFSYFINHERLSIYQLLFISITILGTLLSTLPSKLSLSDLRKSGAVLWPISAAVAIGLSDSLSKKVINATADFSFLFSLALIQVPVAFAYLRIEKQSAIMSLQRTMHHFKHYKNAILGSLFSIVGTGLLWVSFSYTLASIASPITATSSVLLVLLAIVFMDEHLTLKNILAFLMVFIGIMGISLVSS